MVDPVCVFGIHKDIQKARDSHANDVAQQRNGHRADHQHAPLPDRSGMHVGHGHAQGHEGYEQAHTTARFSHIQRGLNRLALVDHINHHTVDSCLHRRVQIHQCRSHGRRHLTHGQGQTHVITLRQGYGKHKIRHGQPGQAKHGPTAQQQHNGTQRPHHGHRSEIGVTGRARHIKHVKCNERHQQAQPRVAGTTPVQAEQSTFALIDQVQAENGDEESVGPAGIMHPHTHHANHLHMEDCHKEYPHQGPSNPSVQTRPAQSIRRVQHAITLP